MSIRDDNSNELRRECCDGISVEDDLIKSLNWFDSGGSTWEYRGENVASFDKKGTLEAVHSPKVAALILLKELSGHRFTKQSLKETRLHEVHLRTALDVIYHIFSKE